MTSARPTRPTRPTRLGRVLQGLGAVVVLLVIVVGVPMFAITLQRATGLHVVPQRIPSLHDIRRVLTQRDNGQLVAVILAAGVWICWALFTVSLIPEIIATARKRPARPLPGLAVFQRPAGALVAAVAIGFTVAPLIAGAGSTGRAAAAPATAPTGHSAPMRPGIGTARSGSAHAVLDSPTTLASHAAPSRPKSAPTYTVRPRDTLWKIAEDHLRNPLRYPEIVHLNPGLIGPDNELTPGTVLTMPLDATGLPTGSDGHLDVTVDNGDTLSGLVEEATGSRDWQSAWRANVGRTEPGGEHFTDPNLIRPGWTLSIPTDTANTIPPAGAPRAFTPPAHHPHPAPSPATPPRTIPRTPTPRRAQPAIPSTPATPTAPAESSRPAPPASAGGQHNAATARADSSDPYEAFEVGGGLLAAVAVAALMVHRQRKFRHRRLGRAVAALPPELIPLEQALYSSGRPALAKMTFLDLSLRHLAAQLAASPTGTLPDIVGAAINDDYLELYLAAPAGPPPEPWLATSDLRWTLSRSAELSADVAHRLAPYPCLVSVGYTADGTEYLLDLEHAGALQLVGDQRRCLDLARYMVAELANNVWSDHLTVTVTGFGNELVAANPTRVAYADDAPTAAAAVQRIAAENREAAAEAAVSVLQGRLHGTAGDVWMPHVLLVAPSDRSIATDVDAAAAAAVEGGRAAVAVVLVGRERTPAARQVTVTETGALSTSLLPLGDTAAFGVPAEQAAEMAQAIALDRDGELDEPMPASAGGRPWDGFTDAAGALLPQYTLPRQPSGPTTIELVNNGSSSVLPQPDAVYVDEAATTTEDLATLAPAVPSSTRAAVEEADPELDDLVAAWFDPDSQLAKLDVLAPAITLTAPAADRRRRACKTCASRLRRTCGTTRRG